MSNIKEPQNRPKERIEHLLSVDDAGNDRRMYERKIVEPGAEVYFPLICKGEVMDVSDDGISVRFKPLECPSLSTDSEINLTMTLDAHTFRIPGQVKRVETRFGVVVIGLAFDPGKIAVEE